MLDRAIAAIAALLGLLVAAPEVQRATPAAAAPDARGISLWGWTAEAYGTGAAAGALRDIKALGATWVTFTPVWYVDGAEGAGLARDAATATDVALRTGIRRARALGLHVALKPHLDRRDGGWRGDIRPADPEAFFAAYGQVVRHYADLAAAEGVAQLVVGTELAGVSRLTARWRTLVSSVRARYDGSITYAALHFEVPKVRFWDRLDVIGVNTWGALADEATTDVAALAEAFDAQLAPVQAVARRTGRRVLVTEAGFASQHGTATAPWSWTLSTRAAPDQQAAGYAAVLRALADEPWVTGLHWWAWRADGRTEPLDFTPQAKPAAEVLRSAWAG